MKTLIIPVFALLGVVACTNVEEPEIIDNNGEPVEVKLNAQLSNVVANSKALIPQDENGALTEALSGVQFIQSDGAAADWTTATSALAGTIETTGSITFGDTPPHYPLDGTVNTHITGYYPAATSISSGSLSMTITGQEDVIYAPAVSGSKNTPIDDKLTFAHKLSQFKFIIKRAAETTADIAEVKVTIKVNSVFSMAIADGALSAWGTPIDITPLTGGTAATAPSAASDPIMLEPGLKTLLVNVTGTGFSGTAAVTAKDAEGFLAGKSYTITLSLGAQDVSGDAAIGKWENGNNPDEAPVQ